MGDDRGNIAESVEGHAIIATVATRILQQRLLVIACVACISLGTFKGAIIATAATRILSQRSLMIACGAVCISLGTFRAYFGVCYHRRRGYGEVVTNCN